MSKCSLRVVKVGGSLLTFEGLDRQLREWIPEQTPAVNVLVTGGGAAADLVRDAAQRFGINEEQSHGLAIMAMGLTANILQALLPEAVLVDSFSAIQSAAENAWLIVDPEPLLLREAARLGSELLPHNWNTTSDSIAARIAEALDADELVLLKSRALAGDKSWQEAADEGYIDSNFPAAVAGLKQVRAVNLRDVNLPAGALDHAAPKRTITLAAALTRLEA